MLCACARKPGSDVEGRKEMEGINGGKKGDMGGKKRGGKREETR
jgi:hypothetical protein